MLAEDPVVSLVHLHMNYQEPTSLSLLTLSRLKVRSERYRGREEKVGGGYERHYI
jgi:hypothetical protein